MLLCAFYQRFMWRFISRILFFVSGWKVEGDYPEEVKKAVLIAAPHTSNWDFIFSRAGLFLMNAPVKFLIKKEWVEGPAGFLLKKLGAIPVDRSATGRTTSFVDEISNLFPKYDKLAVMIAPEGTRKRVTRWRSGFYHIALKANVPILFGYLDYKKKNAGVGGVFYPTGNFEEDLEKIKDFYKTVTAKYPDKGVN